LSYSGFHFSHYIAGASSLPLAGGFVLFYVWFLVGEMETGLGLHFREDPRALLGDETLGYPLDGG
jgi:hypothetical protein